MSTTLSWSEQVAGAPLPPLVAAPPWVGSVVALMRDTPGFLCRSAEQYGPIFRVRALGNTITVLAGQSANRLLAEADNDLLSNREPWQGVCDELQTSQLLTALTDAQHTRQRRVLKPGLARPRLLEQLPDALGLARTHVAALQPGQTVSVVRLFQQIVSDQLGLLLVGEAPGAYFDDLRLMLRYMLNCRFVHAWPQFMLAAPAYRRAKARTLEFAGRLRDAHQVVPAESRRPDLVDDLLAADAADPALFGEPGLLASVLIPYLAGLDTVANTATFMLYALLANPASLARVVAEVDQVGFAGDPSPNKLRELRLLHAAALESMRLFPVAPSLMRIASRSFCFAGHLVPAGQPVMVATTVTARSPELFADPQRFDLDRFLPPRNEHQQRGAFAPFGLGPHTCLGAGLAEVQLAIILSTLLRDVEVTLEPGYRPRVRVDGAPTLGPGFRVRVLRRR